MPLNGIDNYCNGDKAPGLVTIQYAPVAWIDKASYRKIIGDVTGEVWNWQQDIPFATNGWLSASALPNGRQWSEGYARSKQGKTYEQKVVAVIPDLLPSVAREFDEMAEHAFILKLTLKDGRQWLVGTLDFPLRFFSDGDSGTTSGGRKGHAIRFEGPTIHKAHVYDPEW